MRSLLCITVIIVLFAYEALLAPVSTSQTKDKGKQTPQPKPRRKYKPRYEPPPIDVAYKMSPWELAQLKPKQPKKSFARLFANHPQIKNLDPKRYTDKPQVLAEAFAKLRAEGEENGPHRKFTATVRTYLRGSGATQHVEDTVLGHHKRARKVIASRKYDKSKKRRKGTEKTGDEIAPVTEKKDYHNPQLTFEDLLAKHQLPDKMPAADLAEHSKALLQGIPGRQATVMLQMYMRDKGYIRSDQDEVQSCRTRHCQNEANKARTQKGRLRRASTSASGSQTLPEPITSTNQFSPSRLVPPLPRTIPSPPRQSSPKSDKEGSDTHHNDEEWFLSLFN